MHRPAIGLPECVKILDILFIHYYLVLEDLGDLGY